MKLLYFPAKLTTVRTNSGIKWSQQAHCQKHALNPLILFVKTLIFHSFSSLERKITIATKDLNRPVLNQTAPVEHKSTLFDRFSLAGPRIVRSAVSACPYGTARNQWQDRKVIWNIVWGLYRHLMLWFFENRNTGCLLRTVSHWPSDPYIGRHPRANKEKKERGKDLWPSDPFSITIYMMPPTAGLRLEPFAIISFLEADLISAFSPVSSPSHKRFLLAADRFKVFASLSLLQGSCDFTPVYFSHL